MVKIGTEWIQSYSGYVLSLSNAKASADGFVSAFSGSTSVQTAFQYGNGATSDSHFEEGTSGLDTLYVEQVDMVYFAGHGSSTGPKFLSPSTGNDGGAITTELRWGNAAGSRLKWVVLDCCSALLTLSTASPSGSDTLARWAGAFGGIHQILGFRTACTDEGSRGKIFGDYLAAGESVRSAWRKACQETEDSTRKYAVLRKEGAFYQTLSNTTGPAGASAPINYESGSC